LKKVVEVVFLQAEVVKLVLLLVDVVWLAEGGSGGCISAGEGSILLAVVSSEVGDDFILGGGGEVGFMAG
jgi:hypothetical protein